MTILDEISAKTKARVEQRKSQVPLSVLRAQAQALPDNTGFPFERALKKPGMSLICEVKRASPSKGLIAPDFPYLQIAQEYEAAGADAISCLTEPFYFHGHDAYLQEIAAARSIPVLRKDFTIDAYMIYEAKLLGAAAILLICAILSDSELKEYLTIAEELGLSALVEAHTEDEIARAINCGARIIGVNNRDLKTFRVDLATSIRLRKLVPPTLTYVSESGIQTAADLTKLYQNGTDAVLIGETLMRAPNKKQLLHELRAKTSKGNSYDEKESQN